MTQTGFRKGKWGGRESTWQVNSQVTYFFSIHRGNSLISTFEKTIHQEILSLVRQCSPFHEYNCEAIYSKLKKSSTSILKSGTDVTMLDQQKFKKLFSLHFVQKTVFLAFFLAFCTDGCFTKNPEPGVLSD